MACLLLLHNKKSDQQCQDDSIVLSCLFSCGPGWLLCLLFKPGQYRMAWLLCFGSRRWSPRGSSRASSKQLRFLFVQRMMRDTHITRPRKGSTSSKDGCRLERTTSIAWAFRILFQDKSATIERYYSVTDKSKLPVEGYFRLSICETLNPG